MLVRNIDILRCLAAAACCAFLWGCVSAEAKAIVLEAEKFPTKAKVQAETVEGVACVRFADLKEGKIEAPFDLPKSGAVDVWVRLWVEWDDYRVAVAIDGGDPKVGWKELPEDTKSRWDLENVEVWHWLRIPVGDIKAGKHTLTVIPKTGDPLPAVDKVAIAYATPPAWHEEWLAGDMAKLTATPAAAAITGDATVVQAEALQHRAGCRVEGIGEAGDAVVIQNSSCLLGGTIQCAKAGDYDVWVRAWYESANSFESPLLHEFSFGLYFALDGEMQRTVCQTDQQHWRWEPLRRVHLDAGTHLIHFWISRESGPVKIDRVAFAAKEEPWGQDWFEKQYAHPLPCGIENALPYDASPVVAGWRAFGSLGKGTTGKMLGKVQDGPAVRPFEVRLPAGDGTVVLEQPKPFRSNEALALRDPETHLELAVRGDGSKAKIEAVLRDATGERFRLGVANSVDWTGWRAVAVPLPRKAAKAQERGNNDGVSAFPLDLTHLVITKSGGASALAFGEPQFTRPLTARARLAKQADKGLSFEVAVQNHSAISQTATVHYALGQVKTGEEETALDGSETFEVPAGKTATRTMEVEAGNAAYAFRYAVGSGKTQRLLCARGAAAQKDLSALVSGLEKKNGAFRLPAPIKGVKRDEVAAKYGKAPGLTVLAGGVEVTSRQYADKVGARHRLRPVGMDLSDEAGWPLIHVPPGQVGIDPELGRVKFPEGDADPPAKAGYVLTGFGVPAQAPPQIRGDNLYMCVGEADDVIVDIRDPKNLAVTGLIENWYFHYLLHFYRDYAYFHTSHRTLVLVDNIANPYRPGRIRSVNLRMDKYGLFRHIFEDAGIAYTTGGHIMDLADPLNPRPVGRHELGGSFFVAPDQARAYSPGEKALTVWDTRDPRKPKKIGQLAAKGNVIGVDGKHLLVRDGETFIVFEGLDKPAEKCRIEFKAEGAYVPKRSDGTAGGALYAGHVYIVDARRAYNQNYSYGPDSPHSRVYTYDLAGRLVDTYEDPKPSEYFYWAVDRDRKVAYVNDGNGPIRSFDLSNPAKPRPLDAILGSVEVRYGTVSPEGLGWFGQYFGGGVFLADVTDPYNPRKVGEFWDGNFNAFQPRYAAHGKIAYLPRGGKGKPGTAVVDCSDPARPKQTATLPSGDAFVLDDRLYLVAGGSLHIYDLADPKQPKELGSAEGAGQGVIGVREGKAYCMSNTMLAVFDVSNPQSPKKLGELADKEHIGRVFHSVEHGGVSRRGYVYVASYVPRSIPISIFDVRDPAKIRYVKTVAPVDHRDTVSSYWGDICLGSCELVGDYFFVPRYGCQVDVYDVSDPENPKFAGGALCGMTWMAGRQVGDFLFIPTIEGLWIADVPSSSQAPDAPVTNK